VGAHDEVVVLAVRVRGTRASGIERFCWDPFSRMGSKIRAEKFFEATATKNVLGLVLGGAQKNLPE